MTILTFVILAFIFYVIVFGTAFEKPTPKNINPTPTKKPELKPTRTINNAERRYLNEVKAIKKLAEKGKINQSIARLKKLKAPWEE